MNGRASIAKKNKVVFNWRTKTENRHMAFGTRRDGGRPWGVENCARHLPARRIRIPGQPARLETFEEVCECVWTEWKSVPYKVKEDAVEQALMAFSTNDAKRKKQKVRRSRKTEVVVQSYTVSFRKSTQVLKTPLQAVFCGRFRVQHRQV